MSKGKHRRPTPTPFQRAASIDSAGIASTAVLMAVVAAAIADQASAPPPVPTAAGAAVVSNAAHTAHAVAADHDGDGEQGAAEEKDSDKRCLDDHIAPMRPCPGLRDNAAVTNSPVETHGRSDGLRGSAGVREGGSR